MNVLEFYKTGGNPEWLPMVRQRFRQHYRDWSALLHTIYYDEKQKVGREKMREVVKARMPPNATIPTKRFVGTWLKQQLANQLFRRGFKAKSIGALIAKRPNELLQADTIFLLKPTHNQHYGTKKPGFMTDKEWEEQLVLQKQDEEDLKKDGFQVGDAYIGAFTMIDVLSRRGYAVPIKYLNSMEAKKKIITDDNSLIKQTEKYFRDKGFPIYKLKKLMTDKGSEFMLNFRNEMNRKAAREQGLYRHAFVFEGKAQANGLVERFNGTLKSILKKMLPREDDGRIDYRNWQVQLPQALKVYNSTIHSTIKMNPNDVTPANANDAARHIRRRAMSMRPTIQTRFTAGTYVRVFMYNKSKQRLYPNYTATKGPLKKLNDDPRFAGVYMIDKVYPGSRDGVGKTTSYSIWGNWVKETQLETLPSDVTNVNPKVINVPQNSPGSLFNGQRYPQASFPRKFVSEELVPLDADEDGFPIAMTDKSEVSVPPRTRASRVKTRASRKSIGAIEKVVNVRGNKAQVLFEDKKTMHGKHWVNIKDVEDSPHYTAYLIRAENRRLFLKKQKADRDKGEYEVEKIIKYREKNGSKEVLVKWVGYKVATYEPVEAVKHLKLWKTFKKKNDIK